MSFDPTYLIVAALGAFTGGIEIVGRYKDAPVKALRTLGALVYIAVNIVVAVAGLYLLRTVGGSFITESDPVKRGIYEVLVAGFGSLAFLRSSIFRIRFNDTDVSVGPAGLLDVLLLAADRGADRRRGRDRAGDVVKAMAQISFDKAYPTLPPFCFAVMQNLTEAEQKAFSTQIKAVSDSVAIHPHVKSLLLGLALMNVVGIDVLRAAVDSLRDHIKYDTAPPSPADTKGRFDELLSEAKKALGASDGSS